MNNDLPMLRGTVTRTWWHIDADGTGKLHGLLECWCPVCRRYHIHGWMGGDTSRNPRHRAPHCDGGPFHDKGYLVAPWPKKSPEGGGHVVDIAKRVFTPADATAPCSCRCRPMNGAAQSSSAHPSTTGEQQ